ncbi:MAG: DUF1919 domain-containing protein [Ruminococcaceae bacterium]|nr:DUF1919 domain-containing protein [Oscillospiraceae bacterium]
MKSTLKRFIKELILKLPFIKARQKKYIKHIQEHYSYPENTPTIIASTCIGGMISHNLGLKFMSPTVNIWMTPEDLAKFVCDLDRYLALSPVFQKNTGYDFPVGKLDDVTVYFQHYHSDEEALEKWEERKLRIDRDNLYIITDDKRLSSQSANRLINAKYKRLIIFTSDDTKSEPYFPYKCYAKKDEVGFYSVRGLGGFAPFEKEFNYSKWLNGEKDFRIDNWSLMIK